MSQRPIQYADDGFNRVAERRTDDAWLAQKLEATDTRFVVIAGRKQLMAGERPYLLSPSALQSWLSAGVALGEQAVLLGEVDGAARFGITLPEEAVVAALGDEHVRLVGLRDVASELDPVEATCLAYAGALSHWHAGHGYCPVCGAATRSEQAGHVRRCSDERCARTQFPRTDPAVICLVTDGDQCLLARRTIWPENRRSTLAGFVEPSETLEQAVRREIFEEVGVRVGQVDYRGSQPWPFPASLMLGFWARAETREITVDNDEIAEAHWFTRDEVIGGSADGSLLLPPPDSISRALVQDWLDAG